MYIRIIFAILAFLISFTTTAESFMVTCKGTNSNVEVNDFMNLDPFYSHLSFKFGNVTYEFENGQIMRNRHTPIAAVAEQGNTSLGYYVPNTELNSASLLLRGRVFIAVKENGVIIDKKSAADNAICTVRSNKK